MTSPTDLLGIYLHLARASKLRMQPQVSVKLFTLAGVQAQERGLSSIAMLCRQQALAQNPRYLLRRWPTLEAALLDASFHHHLKQLRRQFPREKAEHMLQSLGVEMAQERATYGSDLEYAAALLGVSVDALPLLTEETLHPSTQPNSPLHDSPLHDSSRQGESSARQATPASNHDLPALLLWSPILLGLMILAAIGIATR